MDLNEPILLVDDDESYRILLRYYLQQRGHRVIEAENGLAACRILEKFPISLILLDLVMPHGEGLETLRLLRRRRNTTRILAMSGASHACMYLNVAMRLGAHASFEKVRPMEELLDLVHSLLVHSLIDQ